MKIAVLHGEIPGDAPEDEKDTLIQVEAIFHTLEDLGYKPLAVPFSLALDRTIDLLRQVQPGMVFNLVESVAGQGRLIHLAPAILDYLKLPYTGAGTEAVFLTSNKLMAKKLLRTSGIPTPEWFTIEGLGEEGLPLHQPYIVKSVWEHASVGLEEDSVLIPGCWEQLRGRIEQQSREKGGEFFAETYIEGREFNLSLLAGDGGVEVLPPAEIRFLSYPAGKVKVVGYQAKWNRESFEYRHTVRSFDFGQEDGAMIQGLNDLAQKCWQLFALRGYARVDFRVDSNGGIWVLEVNVNPCLSPEGGFLAAAQRAGLSLAGVVERIMEHTLPFQSDRRPERLCP